MVQVWFWGAAGVMGVMVATILIQALRRASVTLLAPPGAEDVAVYRDQLAEVERDLARGTLPEAEAGRLRLEISRRLLEADRKLQAAVAAPAPASHRPAVLAVAFALAAGGAIYLWLGAPGYPDLPISARLAMAQKLYDSRPSQAEDEAAAPPAAPAVAPDAQFLDLMTKLRAAVQQRPDDQQGLQLLTRYEGMLGNFAEARKAQEHLIALKGGGATAEDQAGLAELMIMAAGGLVSPEAEQVLVQALTLDPQNGPARFYSGLMFAQVGRPDRAFALWQPLLEEGPPDAPWIAPIRAQIEGVADAAGINYALPDAKGPGAADMAAAAQMSPEERQAMIAGMVGQLEERLNGAGGPVEDWVKLITSLGVLGEADRARAALTAAEAAFEGHPGELAALNAAAAQAGLAP